jgi:hypothetical protein
MVTLSIIRNDESIETYNIVCLYCCQKPKGTYNWRFGGAVEVAKDTGSGGQRRKDESQSQCIFSTSKLFFFLESHRQKQLHEICILEFEIALKLTNDKRAFAI